MGFNPSEHKVDEVLDHLEGAAPEEVAAVVAAEEADKNRKSIVESDAAEALAPAQFTEEQRNRTEPDGRVKYPWEV